MFTYVILSYFDNKRKCFIIKLAYYENVGIQLQFRNL